MNIVILYRTISQEELIQLRSTGRFELIDSLVEGKYFAETHEHAAAWGRRLFSSRNSYVIRVLFSSVIADQFYRWDRLDGIGPARFASVEQLADAAYEIQEIIV